MVGGQAGHPEQLGIDRERVRTTASKAGCSIGRKCSTAIGANSPTTAVARLAPLAERIIQVVVLVVGEPAVVALEILPITSDLGINANHILANGSNTY